MKFIETEKGFVNPTHITRFAFKRPHDPGPGTQLVPGGAKTFSSGMNVSAGTASMTPATLKVTYSNGMEEEFVSTDALALFEALKTLQW